MVVAVLAVLAVLSLVAAVVMGGLWLSERNKAADLRADRASELELRGAYADFATEVLTHLMTIRQETLAEDVDRIIGDIEGDFAEQFSPRKDSYKEVVETTKVVADGTVTAAAVEDLPEELAGPRILIRQDAEGSEAVQAAAPVEGDIRAPRLPGAAADDAPAPGDGPAPEESAEDPDGHDG